MFCLTAFNNYNDRHSFPDNAHALHHSQAIAEHKPQFPGLVKAIQVHNKHHNDDEDFLLTPQ